MNVLIACEGFRPHQGNYFFNWHELKRECFIRQSGCFRPHQEIIFLTKLLKILVTHSN